MASYNSAILTFLLKQVARSILYSGKKTIKKPVRGVDIVNCLAYFERKILFIVELLREASLVPESILQHVTAMVAGGSSH